MNFKFSENPANTAHLHHNALPFYTVITGFLSILFWWLKNLNQLK